MDHHTSFQQKMSWFAWIIDLETANLADNSHGSWTNNCSFLVEIPMIHWSIKPDILQLFPRNTNSIFIKIISNSHRSWCALICHFETNSSITNHHSSTTSNNNRQSSIIVHHFFTVVDDQKGIYQVFQDPRSVIDGITSQICESWNINLM